MATHKRNGEASDTQSGNVQDNTQESLKSKQPEEPHFGKALAHRALYGANSSSRRSGGRKLGTNDARAPPSRLSKVSSAEEEEK
ncbi:hypothetical protein L484_007458 [Morus notabilis]|uniref:Uncharacterized protein n=1 Tax=Morus notabilis TaxID=981085 RepID=W9RWE1_9ROSA|nr:hypothetical protein L484_007458 [Morus notabilis]